MPKRNKKLDQHIQTGKTALSDAQYLQALQAFQQALELDPNHLEAKQGAVTALTKLADRAESDGDQAVLIAHLEKAHRLRREDVQVHQRLATARYNAYVESGYQRGYPVPKGNPQRVDNLVFQGGGIKGLAYIGATRALSRYVDLNGVKRLGGASAGSVAATLLAAGYTLEEYEKLIGEVDFASFMDGDFRDTLLRLVTEKEEVEAWGKEVKGNVQRVAGTSHHPSAGASGASHLLRAKRHPYAKAMMEAIKRLHGEQLGLFPGDTFREDWIEKYLQRKLGIHYVTFQELHDLKTKVPEKFGHLKDPYFVGVNLQTGAIEVFSYETTPDVIVSDALRISMSIPMIFYPHQAYIKKPDGCRVPHESGHWYVDGGMLDNYPLWLFDKAKYVTGNERDIQLQENPYTLGFRLVTGKRLESYTEGALPYAELKRDLPSYALQLIDTIYHKQESDHIKRLEKHRTVYIDYLGVNTVAFDLTEEDQQSLIDSGEVAVIDYFKQRVGMGATHTGNMLESVRSGNTRAVYHLADQGVLAEVRDADGRSGLDIALAANASSMVVTLVKLGARLCQAPEGILSLLREAKSSPWVDTTNLEEATKVFAEHYGLEAPSAGPGFF